MDQATYDIVTDPGFEIALRAKAKDVLGQLDTMQVQASPLTFTCQDVAVTILWGTRDVEIKIDDGYDIVMPLAWLTGP